MSLAYRKMANYVKPREVKRTMPLQTTALRGEADYIPSPTRWDQSKMEQHWIEQSVQGDKTAFSNIVKMHLPAIVALAKRMLNSEAEAEDLAQEVLISLWQKLDAYDQAKGKLSTWIYRITANRCLDRLRERKVDQLDDDYDQEVPPRQEKELFEKQMRKSVEATLNKLPPRQKLALVLFHYQGHSLKEIAEILDAGEEAIESLLARARRTLKQTLLPSWQQYMQKEGR